MKQDGPRGGRSSEAGVIRSRDAKTLEGRGTKTKHSLEWEGKKDVELQCAGGDKYFHTLGVAAKAPKGLYVM